MEINKDYYQKEWQEKLNDRRPHFWKDQIARITNTTIEYDGRQILELLQNSDDAISDFFSIELKNGILTICDNGKRDFSYEGLVSLLWPSNSPKENDNTVTGKKGLGMRALITWIDEIEIISTQFDIVFNKENHKKYFDDNLKKILESLGNEKSDYTLPFFSYPQWKNGPLLKIGTKIIIKVNKQYLNDVKNIIEKICYTDILFTRNLRHICISTDSYENKIIKVRDKKKIYIKDEKINAEFNFNIIYDENNIIVLEPLFDVKENYIYNIFKTNIKINGFPYIFSADFGLYSNRNDLVKTPENYKIFNDFALIVKNLIEQKNNDYCDRAIFFIKIFENKVQIFDDFKFYLNMQQHKNDIKIFRCLDGLDHSYNEKVVYSHCEFYKYLYSQDFPLLIANKINKINNYFNNIEINADYFSKIKYDSSKYTFSQWANIIKLFIDCFQKDVLSNFLIDEKCIQIEPDKGVYVAPSKIEWKIPEWAPISFLNKSLAEELDLLYKPLHTSKERYSINNITYLNVSEYLIKPILEKLLNSANNDNKYDDIVITLYNYYTSAENQNNNELPKIPIVKLKNKKGVYKKSNLLYNQSFISDVDPSGDWTIDEQHYKDYDDIKFKKWIGLNIDSLYWENKTIALDSPRYADDNINYVHTFFKDKFLGSYLSYYQSEIIFELIKVNGWKKTIEFICKDQKTLFYLKQNEVDQNSDFRYRNDRYKFDRNNYSHLIPYKNMTNWMVFKIKGILHDKKEEIKAEYDALSIEIQQLLKIIFPEFDKTREEKNREWEQKTMDRLKIDTNELDYLLDIYGKSAIDELDEKHIHEEIKNKNNIEKLKNKIDLDQKNSAHNLNDDIWAHSSILDDKNSIFDPKDFEIEADIVDGDINKNDISSNYKKSLGETKRIKQFSKEDTGYAAEVIVYTTLKKQGLNNNEWVSGYAKKQGINNQGNDFFHYDFKFKNNYIEVKTQLIFTVEEIKFGINNKNNYWVYLVNVSAQPRPQITKIKIFDFNTNEDLFHNNKFTLEGTSFRLKCNIFTKN